MPVYRIFRMKENPRQQFKWAPHSSGATAVKPKDFEEGPSIEADSAYALWFNLRCTDQALKVGDVIELPTGDVRIYKYVGLEEAKWVLPEVRPLEARSPEAPALEGPQSAAIPTA
ncbi:MAG: hypothetical protein FJW40_08655 [Acidobacteria bacterium]|nr:hypothetical protein [Acidobacteriota bacterium]